MVGIITDLKTLRNAFELIEDYCASHVCSPSNCVLDVICHDTNTYHNIGLLAHTALESIDAYIKCLSKEEDASGGITTPDIGNFILCARCTHFKGFEECNGDIVTDCAVSEEWVRPCTRECPSFTDHSSGGCSND